MRAEEVLDRMLMHEEVVVVCSTPAEVSCACSNEARALGIAMFGATLDYQYNWGAVGMWLIFILLISMIASIMPANTATRISVRDSLAYA